MNDFINSVAEGLKNKKDIMKEDEIKKYLDKNSKAFIAHITDINLIIKLNNEFIEAAVLSIISYFLNNEEIKLDPNSTYFYIDIPNHLLKMSVWKISPNTVNTYLNLIFHNLLIKNNSLNEIAINLFSQLTETFNSQFCCSKAYLYYYAYKLKNYKIIEKFQSQLVNNVNSNLYNVCFDFQLMCYYKGLIHLSLREINEATTAFIQCFDKSDKHDKERNEGYDYHMKNLFSEKHYTHFQIESFKRLLLLNFVAHPSLKKLIEFVVKSNSIIFTGIGNVYQFLIPDIKTKHHNNYLQNESKKLSFANIIEIEKGAKQLFEKDKILVRHIFIIKGII